MQCCAPAGLRRADIHRWPLSLRQRLTRGSSEDARRGGGGGRGALPASVRWRGLSIGHAKPRWRMAGGGGSSGAALDSHPFFPSHVASGRCFLSAAAAGAPAGVVSAFAEPSGWCVGAVLNVAGCAVCASAALSSWRIGAVLVVARVV